MFFEDAKYTTDSTHHVCTVFTIGFTNSMANGTVYGSSANTTLELLWFACIVARVFCICSSHVVVCSRIGCGYKNNIFLMNN